MRLWLEGEDMNKFDFRFAEEKDAALILQFIKELAAYENDPVIVSAMRQACHYNLYALVNSAAMNGIGENTQVKPQALYVVTLLRVLMGLCAAAAVVFGILWHRG